MNKLNYSFLSILMAFNLPSLKFFLLLISKGNSYGQNNVNFTLGENQWIAGPDAPEGMDRDGFCMVTLDDCHTAWLGGAIYETLTEGEEPFTTYTYTPNVFLASY